MRPILAIPVGDRLRCLALSLYGPHLSGNDLNHDERTMLAELADKAASVLMKLTDDELRGRIATLERELRAVRHDPALYRLLKDTTPAVHATARAISCLGHQLLRAA